MAESFDAVLAAIRKNGFAGRLELNCLQSAHAAEVAEVRDSARHEAVAMGLLADRAVGLLRECWGYVKHEADEEAAMNTHRVTPRTSEARLLAEITAFLLEQAGERENGDG